MWRHAIPDATQPMWQMRHEKLPLDVRQWRKVVPGCCWLLLIIQNSVTLSKHIWGLKENQDGSCQNEKVRASKWDFTNL